MKYILTIILLLFAVTVIAAPEITNVSGTVQTGKALTISGTAMVNEDQSSWDSFYATNPKASGFEGESLRADGYSAIGPSGGQYVSNVKLLGNQSAYFNINAPGPLSCPAQNRTDYNGFALHGGSSADYHFRMYVRYNATNWPYYIKMLDLVNVFYLQPRGDSIAPFAPSDMIMYDGTDPDEAVPLPSGNLKFHRWYLVEVRWKGTAPYHFDVWIDNEPAALTTQDNVGKILVLAFGIINGCSEQTGFNVDHWVDGLAASNSGRIFGASIVEISGDGGSTWQYQQPEYLSDTSSTIIANLPPLTSDKYLMRVTDAQQQVSNTYDLGKP